MEVEFELIHEEALYELLKEKDLEQFYDTITEDHTTDCFDNDIRW